MGQRPDNSEGQLNSDDGETDRSNTGDRYEAASEGEVRERRWQERHRRLYQINLSELYHRRRERFFDLLDRSIKAVALFGGSAAFAAATTPHAVRIAGLVIAASSAVALVFNFSGAARRHSSLATRFVKLESQIRECAFDDITEVDLAQWESRIAEIESDEPPTLPRLVDICQNDLNAALGKAAQNVPRWKRALAYV